MQIIGDCRRARLVIGEVDKIRNLELFPVPARYSDRVLMKFDSVEFKLLPSFLSTLRSKRQNRRAENELTVESCITRRAACRLENASS